MHPEYEIRLALADEIALLPALEEEATQRFWSIDDLRELPDDITAVEDLAAACELGNVWVAVTPEEDLVGFAYGTRVDDCFHLEEVAVSQAWGRRGVGRALLRAVADYAARAGYPAVTLTTYRDVAWNAPFYAKLGFAVVESAAWTQGLLDAVRAEESRGLPPALRVVMQLEL